MLLTLDNEAKRHRLLIPAPERASKVCVYWLPTLYSHLRKLNTMRNRVLPSQRAH